MSRSNENGSGAPIPTGASARPTAEPAGPAPGRAAPHPAPDAATTATASFQPCQTRPTIPRRSLSAPQRIARTPAVAFQGHPLERFQSSPAAAKTSHFRTWEAKAFSGLLPHMTRCGTTPAFGTVCSQLRLPPVVALTVRAAPVECRACPCGGTGRRGRLKICWGNGVLVRFRPGAPRALVRVMRCAEKQ